MTREEQKELMKPFFKKVQKEVDKENNKTHMYIITDKNHKTILRIDEQKDLIEFLGVSRHKVMQNINNNFYGPKKYINNQIVYKIPTRFLSKDHITLKQENVIIDKNGTVADLNKQILPFIDIKGQRYVKIDRINKSVTKLMRLAYFDGKPVIHEDGNKKNNKLDNLLTNDML